MSEQSPTLAVRLRGPLACFTRPEFKTERVSYEVMTPSAARGALEAILWKPAIVWRIERIRVLKPIRFTAFMRNEVTKRMSPDSTGIVADDETTRAQRNTVALADVDYVVEAHFDFTPKKGDEDNMGKFLDMFRRRVEGGQCHHRPYLGCREFAADFLPSENAPPPIPETRDLGLMLHDKDYANGARARLFPARLENGILLIPPWSPNGDAQ
jgi:CRISPR-associated protein Cas5d